MDLVVCIKFVLYSVLYSLYIELLAIVMYILLGIPGKEVDILLTSTATHNNYYF